MSIRYLWELSLYDKLFLFILLIINLLGSLYGYIWYGNQLSHTALKYVIFVPDSPTATLFLSLVLIMYLFKKSFPIIEVIAFMTLIKYGIWAVVMNIILFIQYQEVSLAGLLLLISHGFMAFEGIYVSLRVHFTVTAIIVGSLWLILNDFIDYIKLQYPSYEFITHHLLEVGLFSIFLSIMCVIISALIYRVRAVKLFD